MGSVDMIISDIAEKVLEQDDENDELSFVIKALVQNESEDTDIYIQMQGLDSEGFELYDLPLAGTIPIAGKKILTTREYHVKQETYDQIVEWGEK
jgi:hypothetical protein